jgi:hypothetical protein
MRPTDKPELVRVLVGMASLKRVDLTAEALDLWCAAMADWDIAEFKAAASHLVKAHEWMPTPFHFEQLRRAGEPTAGEAWERVVSGAKLIPGSREARAAVIVGGQQAIRMANIEKDLPFIAKRFREAFEELKDVDSVRTALPHFAGQAIPDMRARALLKDFS